MNFDALSLDEQQKLLVLLSEAKSRGIDIDLEKYAKRKEYHWPVDDNGYFSKLDGKFYIPNESQHGFVTSNAVFCGFWGSRGSGKTGAGSQKALRKIMAGENGVIANPDFENLKISTWPEFREWIPWEIVVPAHQYRKNPKWEPARPFVLAFVNGVRVIIKGIKDANSARGPNVNWFWFDEAQRTDDALAWQTAIASVRVGNDPQSWATFTANGTNHWTTIFFINKNIPEDALELLEESGQDRLMVEDFHGTLQNNKTNLSPVFVASIMAAYPEGWLRDQEVYGKIVRREGALGNPAWFDGRIIPAIPDEAQIYARCRYWDLAATEKKIGVNDPDETVGAKLSYDKEADLFYIEDQVCGHWEWTDIKQTILHTALFDGPYIPIYVEQEPGSGGKNQVAEIENFIRENLPEFTVRGHRPREHGDKVMRANVWFADAAQGKFYMIQGEWNGKFLDQLGSFPYARHDDRIDAVSGARVCVAPINRWRRIKFLSL